MIENQHPVEKKLKPWGHEIWFAHTPQYAGKILHIKKGHRYSLQYHERKIETQYVYSGQIKFIYGTSEDNLQERIMNPGDKIDVHPPLIHRIEAIEDAEVFEVSTPDLDDVIKLHDDYGRTGSGNDHAGDAALHSEHQN